MMTTIIDSASTALAVGAAVDVVFVDRDGWTFPAFRVAGSADVTGGAG